MSGDITLLVCLLNNPPGDIMIMVTGLGNLKSILPIL